MTRYCAACGAVAEATDRFCGRCGASVVPVVGDAPSVAAPTPVRGPRGWPTFLLGALGACVLLVAGIGTLRAGARPDRSPAVPDASEPEAASGPAQSGGAPSGTSPSGGGGSLAPIAPGPETESPDAYPYARRREDCSAQSHLTDPFKELAHGVDDAIRSGSRVSRSEEDRIGRDVMSQFTRQAGGTLDSSSRDAQYLSQVGAHFTARVSRTDVTYRFYLWEGTDQENALAIPGGHVIVSRPLWERWLTNEAQLAAVVGHEVAHVDLRHPLAVVEALRAVGGQEDDEIASLITRLVQLPYSTVTEERADRWAAVEGHGVGYSVFQAVRMWEARAAAEDTPAPVSPEEGGLFGVVVGTVFREAENVLTTHPGAARRACLLRQAAYDAYRAQPRDAAWVGTRGWRERRALGGGP